MVVLYGNGLFSILLLSTKKRYYSFLKKVFFFPEKLEYWKRSKFPLIVTWEHNDLLPQTEGYFENS